jgi:hypothetical protein
VRRETLDFSGIKQHPASNTDGPKLSCTLQPEERCFANLQNRQSLGTRKQARDVRLLPAPLI